MGGKLVEIENARKVIFVGDTHGDVEASRIVAERYLKEGNKLVFLGDYVDRGKHSKENLDFLIELREKNPDDVYLLQGNHEGHHVTKFYPADFWEGLNPKEYKKYSLIVSRFPLVAVVGEILALHGALPGVKSLRDMNGVRLGSVEWREITWGDFLDVPGNFLGYPTGRPTFGRDYFFNLMERFNKRVLIRSHQPNAPLFMFGKRCITIFTSSAYGAERTVAVADMRKRIRSADDIEIRRI